ncbi:PREDICTED: uncharacterized protein KIAA1644 homolog [Chinchilla lanigera]|uniref:uncharacterized protein KIAA1644 homolog n=1 Tax=Chinchilla lanigera TaxID=34839 RepID=UPI0006965243|nr:PREDICTED: uncharacterized protein KIAA1644 homolog [Chinchilla lanigera]XP_013367933.1 PREDICTED: uncharacterized protein KIAA1644 homolog [Chinchilla lanigera]
MSSQRKRPGLLLTGLSLRLLLLFSWRTLARPTSRSALVQHPYLCHATRDADGRHHPGFFCPRLSDSREEAYCCHLQAAGGSCCTRAEFEALYKVNLSAVPPPRVLRGAGSLLALGLYSLLLVALVTADFVHFYRGRRRGKSGSGRAPSRSSSTARPLQVPVGID